MSMTMTATPSYSAGFVGKVKLALARRRAFNQTFNELNKLSMRELNDIGLAPGDIYYVAREAADMA